MSSLSITLLCSLAVGVIIVVLILQRRHAQTKSAFRKELASLTDAEFTTIKRDDEALVGDINHIPFKYYTFDKGRGGLYLRIEMDVSNPASVRLHLSSGLPNLDSEGMTEKEKEFLSRFHCNGTTEWVSLLQESDLRKSLLDIERAAGNLNLNVAGTSLLCEWRDHGQNSPSEIMELLVQLSMFAHAIRENTP